MVSGCVQKQIIQPPQPYFVYPLVGELRQELQRHLQRDAVVDACMCAIIDILDDDLASLLKLVDVGAWI